MLCVKPAVTTSICRPTPSKASSQASKEAEYNALLNRLKTSFQNERVWEIATSKTKISDDRSFLVHPDSKYAHFWDACVLLLVLYNAFALPIVVAFEPAQPPGWVAFDYIVDVIFVADLVKNFRTAYFNANNELVQDTQRISRRYVHSWFAVDLIASIPFELFAAAATGASVLGRGDSSQISLRLVSALKSIRLLRLGRFAKIADRWKFGNLWSIVRQYVGIVLLAHWLACVWFLVSNSYESDSGDNWLVVQGLHAVSSREQYISCMLAAVLMLFRTLGNPPVTVEEKLFLLIAVLLGAAVHATIFGQVAHLVSQLSSKESIYRHRMRQLYERMRYYDLPPALQERVTIYFDTLWKRHRIVDTKDMLSFTGSLSEPLQLQVNLFLNREMVQRVPMFQNCHASVIVQVVQSLQSHFFIPGDYVVRAGEMGSHMFFIRDGTCQVLVARAKSAQQLAAEAAAEEQAALTRLAASSRGAWPRLRGQLAACKAPCLPPAGLAGCFGGPPQAADSPSCKEESANPVQSSPEGGAGGVPILPSQSPEEELMVVKTLQPGDFFGEVSLLFRVKRTATICSTAYSDLASLDAVSFERILETNPDFAAKLEEGFQKYLALNQGGAAGKEEGDSDSAGDDGAPAAAAAGGADKTAAPGGEAGGEDSKAGARHGSTSLAIMSRGMGSSGVLQPAAALSVASQMFGHVAVPLPEQGGTSPPLHPQPAAAEIELPPHPHTPTQSSSGDSSSSDTEGERPSSLLAVQLGGGGASGEASPPAGGHPPAPLSLPRRLSAASAGQAAGLTPLPPSPTNRARRQMQAAIAASDPQRLWTAKVTQTDLANSSSPPPSHSLQAPPAPEQQGMPRALSLGTAAEQRGGGSPAPAFLQQVQEQAAAEQRRRHSAVHDIRRGASGSRRSSDAPRGSWAGSNTSTAGRAGRGAGTPSRQLGQPPESPASPALLGHISAHVQSAAAAACAQGMSALLQQQEAFMARLPAGQAQAGEEGGAPTPPQTDASAVQAALQEVRTQQRFLLESFSAVAGQLEVLSAGLHSRLAALEDAVAAAHEGEASPDTRRARSSSVFHKSAVVV